MTRTTPIEHAGTRLLTIPQVAERLACSRATVYRLIADGLPTVDISAASKVRTRVDEADLARWIESRKSSSRPERVA